MQRVISRTIPVGRDGNIALPPIRALQASGLSAIQLAGLLRQKTSKRCWLTSRLQKFRIEFTLR